MLEHMQTLYYCDGSPANRMEEADGIPNKSMHIPLFKHSEVLDRNATLCTCHTDILIKQD
jgi:hypothetical protein